VEVEAKFILLLMNGSLPPGTGPGLKVIRLGLMLVLTRVNNSHKNSAWNGVTVQR